MQTEYMLGTITLPIILINLKSPLEENNRHLFIMEKITFPFPLYQKSGVLSSNHFIVSKALLACGLKADIITSGIIKWDGEFE